MRKREDWQFACALICAVGAIVKILEYFKFGPPTWRWPVLSTLWWAILLGVLSLTLFTWALWQRLRGLLKPASIPPNAPRVVPLRYVSVQGGYGLILANEGEEPAHDIRIASFTFGGKGGWTASFTKINRLSKPEEGLSKVQVSGRNCSLDLDWPLQMWQKEGCVIDRTAGTHTFPRPIRFFIIYRDHAKHWYRSICELSRKTLTNEGIYDEGIYLEYIDQERIDNRYPRVCS